MLTKSYAVGSVGSSGSSTSASAMRLPADAYVDAADRCPAASVDTARYSTSVPSARPPTSWKTRGDVDSAVPRGCHSSDPTTRQAKLVCRHYWSVDAATGADPVSAAPGSGTDTVRGAASAGAVTGPSARSTTADRAGTLTDATAAASEAVSAVSP